MTLSERLRAVEDRRPEVTVYAHERDEDLLEALAVRNATVRYRRLPATFPAFVVVSDDDGFVASIGIEHLRELLVPPVRTLGNAHDPTLVRLFEYLDDLAFAALDRRQLLAASREIEDRAYRVGRGTLRVGFQSPAAFRDQLAVYRTLGTDTDLDLHVYVRDDSTPPRIPNATVHAEDSAEIGRYWFLAYDGDGDDETKCGLVAEERDPGSYAGFWTYDPGTVDGILGHLESAYG